MPDGKIDEILRFWFEEIDQRRWFVKDPGFDRELEKRFGELLEQARRQRPEARVKICWWLSMSLKWVAARSRYRS